MEASEQVGSVGNDEIIARWMAGCLCRRAP
jgi:hypothetical protein